MLAAFLVAALVVAGVVSAFASDAPDGLTAVSEDQGFASLEDEHDAADSPFAGYETEGVDDGGLSPALAGVVGVGVTFLLGGGLFLLVRGRSEQRTSAGEAGDHPGDHPGDYPGDYPADGPADRPADGAADGAARRGG